VGDEVKEDSVIVAKQRMKIARKNLLCISSLVGFSPQPYFSRSKARAADNAFLVYKDLAEYIGSRYLSPELLIFFQTAIKLQNRLSTLSSTSKHD